MNYRAMLAWLLLVTLVSAAPEPALAQGPAPLPQPNLDLQNSTGGAGMVYAIAPQHGGGTIIGGRFSSANGAPRNNLLRLMPDGTLDPDWKPSAANTVTGLAVDSSDDVFAIGDFSMIDTLSRNGLAKLSGSGAGTVDPNWNPGGQPGTPFPPYHILVDSMDRIYILSYAGALARLAHNGTGAVDQGWTPAPNSAVWAMALDNDGWLYVGGNFDTVGGVPRQHLAKVSTSNGAAVDPDWNPGSDKTPQALALDGQGSLYAGGLFGTIGGQTRSHLAKLSTSGTGEVDVNWNPVLAGDDPNLLAITSLATMDGGVFVAGGFTSADGYSRNGFARISANGAGAVDPQWDPAPDGSVSPISGPVFTVIAKGHELWVGGAFTTIGAQTRVGIAVFDTDKIFADAFE